MDNQKEVTTVRVTERIEYFELQPFTLKLNWQINCLTGKWNIYINFVEWIERLITVCSGDFSFFSESNCKKIVELNVGTFSQRETLVREQKKKKSSNEN